VGDDDAGDDGAGVLVRARHADRQCRAVLVRLLLVAMVLAG
jgi:hypothetical protein